MRSLQGQRRNRQGNAAVRTYRGDRRGMPYTGNDPQYMPDLSEAIEYFWDQARVSILADEESMLKKLGCWFWDGDREGFEKEYAPSDAAIERRAIELHEEAMRHDF